MEHKDCCQCEHCQKTKERSPEEYRSLMNRLKRADVLIVGGTSLTVYPAAGLLGYYRGDRLALINRDETPYDDMAGLVLHASLGDVFSQL